MLLAFVGQRALRADAFFDAVLWYGAGVVLFIAALWGPAFFPEKAFGLPSHPVAGWKVRRAWVAGALLLAALVLATLAWRGFDATYPDSGTAWQQYVASVALALVAVAVYDFSGTLSHPTVAVKRWAQSLAGTWRVWVALGGLMLLALLLRVFRLDELPFGVWYDEANHGLGALHILSDPKFRPLFDGAIQGPTYYLYLVAASFQLFGVNAASIRLASVFLGVLAVPAAYVVGSELFGRRVGLVLAFLIAVSSWFVTLSRLGMYATSSTPFFSLAALAFLLRALRKGRLFEFALSGLFLGLGLCFYTSFRLFVPVVGLFLLYAAFYEWRRTHALPRVRFWLGVAVVGVMAVLVVAPLVWFATAHADIYWSRVEQTFVFAGKSDAERLPALLENIKRHVLMFNWHGDPNGRHNLPGAPMLDDISAALMVVGLAYSLRRVHDPRYALLPVWLGLTLLGGILSLDFEAPQSLRANGSLGAAYILAVVPIAVLVRSWRVGDGRYYPNLDLVAGGRGTGVGGDRQCRHLFCQAGERFLDVGSTFDGGNTDGRSAQES